MNTAWTLTLPGANPKIDCRTLPPEDFHRIIESNRRQFAEIAKKFPAYAWNMSFVALGYAQGIATIEGPTDACEKLKEELKKASLGTLKKDRENRSLVLSTRR